MRRTHRTPGAPRRALLAALLAGTLAGQAPPAWAEEGTAILENCATGAERCAAYVAAIADTMRNGNAIYGWFACPPAADARQLLETVLKFRTWRQDLRHYSPSALTAHALAAAYPCQRR